MKNFFLIIFFSILSTSMVFANEHQITEPKLTNFYDYHLDIQNQITGLMVAFIINDKYVIFGHLEKRDKREIKKCSFLLKIKTTEIEVCQNNFIYYIEKKPFVYRFINSDWFAY